MKNLSCCLERIEATLLAINSADDERNPPETGITERAIKRVKNGRLYLIPASEETRGHGTTGNAKHYSGELRELLQTAPNRAMSTQAGNRPRPMPPGPQRTSTSSIKAMPGTQSKEPRVQPGALAPDRNSSALKFRV